MRFLGTGETSEVDLQTLGAGAMGFETGLFYSPTHKSARNDAFIKALGEVAPQLIPSATVVGPYDGMHLIYRMIEATKDQRGSARGPPAAAGQAAIRSTPGLVGRSGRR